MCVSDICALFFCVAVVGWMDLLALGRPKWPHGHRLAAIGKGGGYRGAGKSEHLYLTVDNLRQIMKYRHADVYCYR